MKYYQAKAFTVNKAAGDRALRKFATEYPAVKDTIAAISAETYTQVESIEIDDDYGIVTLDTGSGGSAEYAFALA